MQGMSLMPAADHLFKTSTDAERLNTDTAEQFHSLVAKLQWVTQCERPNIHVGISFLLNRVKEPGMIMTTKS